MSSSRLPPFPPPNDRRRPAQQGHYDGPERRAGWRGRSGYGMDSIRRHLRAQLELHSLLRPGFLPPEDGAAPDDRKEGTLRQVKKNPPGAIRFGGTLEKT